MLGKFKPEELMSRQHSFSDAQNAITPSANTAETPFSSYIQSAKNSLTSRGCQRNQTP